MDALQENITRAFVGAVRTADSADEGAGLVQYLTSAYKGARRETGEPYLSYVSDMALRLSDYCVDRASLLAAMTWGLIEIDREMAKEIGERFGDEVQDLALRMVQLSEIDSKTSQDAEQEKFRRLILALARDIRVVFLRLLDRAHVLSRLEDYPPTQPRIMARTARDIYAPLANRLGIGRLRSELEDISLRVLEPATYSDIRRKVRERSNHHEMNVERIKMKIMQRMDEQGIRSVIKSRIKSINSIYKKMQVQKIKFEEVYDVIGMRIVLDSERIQDCYAALGIVHSLWKPIPHRFKDFIAVPKENGYQSIHTSVIGPTGSPLEIQIRSKWMDEIAEMGLAAHWRYKENGSGRFVDGEKFSWMRKVMTYLTEDPSPSDMVEIFKVDMFPSEVYVFTPRGDVKSLPAGSTAIDFAFAIHTEVGFRCKHVRINNRLVPLRTRLNNGDIIEIITSRNSHPHANWLKHVRTSSARNKIRSYLREEAREAMIRSGMEELRKQVKRHRIPMKELFESDEFLEVVQRSGFSSPEDLFAAIGFNEYSVQNVINRLIAIRAALTQKQEAPLEREVFRGAEHVRVAAGIEVPTRFARCCEPLPGDKIVGYITHGRGITIHAADCRSLRKLEKNRVIPVAWESGDRPHYPERIQFESFNTPALMADITRVLVEFGAVIQSQKLEMLDRKGSSVRGVLMVDTQSVVDMDQMIEKLRTIPAMKKIARHQPRTRR
ncbi:bifunctional (p)ppGpp synthetase/guanosine-3',5'-bis(diphosphate) 3'-pyrophosphohydrolase [bacterium]|nr:bifunctional (p)ppGpp synthetase/guanosine-3',5'-bis(diphosphate) 3'-pyrophosphohydrolase [candidate division CSSED10-310 bacterium]